MIKRIPCTLIAAGLVAFTALSAEELLTIQESASVMTTPFSENAQEQAHFKPFTGKIKGKKVRLRIQPDLEAQVVKELDKNELFAVVGEKNGFWAVEPPANTKAYIFRSYILDNVVEGNRVNVRLEPHLEAPVIGHLNSGDRIDGVVSSVNNKWYEIPPPANAHFYVAKDYVENMGGPDVKIRADKRKLAVEQLMESSLLLSKAELRKPYHEVDMERITRNFKTIVNDYTDFPDYVEQAKEALAHLQESYIAMKIAHLEEKESEQPLAEPLELATTTSEWEEKESFKPSHAPTERMKMWAPIEEGLYLSWQRLNEEREMSDFYEEQHLNAVALTGILEPYTSPVKNKPGDFILRDKDLPVAYLYSTQHNLQEFVGKKIAVKAAPRSNNNFAFPAYFVLSVE